MAPNSGNQLVRILTNQPGHLVAQQFMPDGSDHGFSLTLTIIAIVAVGLAIYFYRIAFWKGLLLPLILLIMVGSYVFQSPSQSWRMEFNQQAGTIEYETYSGEKVVAQNQVALSDISSAEMQFDRGDTRIALILRDGTQVLPLGKFTVQNAPNHYVILTAIRNAIGQNPSR